MAGTNEAVSTVGAVGAEGVGDAAAGTGGVGRSAATAEAVPGTGGPRSAGTRRAILEAAKAAFAAHGYDQTTIRAVAATAGVDASMVMRYFGSKAGLFAAAAIADVQVPDLTVVPAHQRGEVLVRHLVERWEDAASRDEMMLLMRTAVTSDAVASQLQAVLGQLITGPVAAVASGSDSNSGSDSGDSSGDGAHGRAGGGRVGDGRGDAAVDERGAFIGAQLLGLALCRYILRQEPLASLPLAHVVAAYAPSVQHYLDAPDLELHPAPVSPASPVSPAP